MTETDSSIQPVDAADFDALVDSWIAEELAASPVEATILGADGDHGSLGAW